MLAEIVTIFCVPNYVAHNFRLLNKTKQSIYFLEALSLLKQLFGVADHVFTCCGDDARAIPEKSAYRAPIVMH